MEKPATDRGVARQVWLPWATRVAAVLALGWSVYLLRDAWPALRANLPRLHPGLTLAGFVIGLIGAYTPVMVFLRLFDALWPGRLPAAQVRRLYFLAQIFKHLPGRVWGVAYQVAATQGLLRMSDWIAVNGLMGVLSLYFSVAAAAAVVLGDQSPAAGAAIAVASVALCMLAWRPSLLQYLKWAAWILPQRLRVRFATLLDLLGGISSRVVGDIALISAAGWILYFGSWGLYGWAYPDLGPHEALLLSAYYTLAWLVGYLSMVTPSGLGVRELAFFWLAGAYSPDVVAVAAVLGRLSLLFNDAILGLVFSARVQSNEPVR